MKEKGISTIFATLFLLVLVVGAVIMFFRGPVNNPEKNFNNQFAEGNIDKAIAIYNEEMVGTELEEEYKDTFMEYIDRAYTDWESEDSSVGNAVHRLKLAQTVNNTDVYNYAQEKLEKIYAVHGEDITYTEEDAKKEFFNEFKKIFSEKD